MPRRLRSSRDWRALPIALFGLATACGHKPEQAKPAPPVVGILTATPTTVAIDVELPGRTAPLQTSDVRPQVNGILERRLFVEGAHVRRGEPLYRIDARLYSASVGQARGNLASAQASAVAARLKAARYGDLETIHAVARQDADDARATAGEAEASIQQNAAALDTARINLGFTTVRAPISGVIGRSLITVGALVSSSQADPLATIQTLDPMFVDIQQSSGQLLALRQAMMTGGALPADAPVRLKLEDGSTYPFPGRLLFAEVTVDASTGSVTLRARFPNPKGLLLPGMFVRAVVTQTRAPGVFVLPPQALQHNPRGDASVLVVGAGDKVIERPVATRGLSDNAWIVTSGIRAGDRIVIEGTGNARAGTVVRPVAATGKPGESALIAPDADAAGGQGGGSGKEKAGGAPGAT